MTRTDGYLAVAVLAWLAGAYWVGASLRQQAEATDRLALATHCSSAGPVAQREWDLCQEAGLALAGRKPAVFFDPFDYKEGELPPCKSGAEDCKPWERDWKGEPPPGATPPE